MSKDSGSILDVKSSINREHGVTRSKFGMVAVGITGTIVAGLFVGTLPFLTPALRQICLPYVPATTTQVANILRMCKGRPGTLVDLGSGDGRVMPKLQGKFVEEMKPDARVVACRFPLPDWQPEAVICAGIDTVWRYKKCSSNK